MLKSYNMHITLRSIVIWTLGSPVGGTIWGVMGPLIDAAFLGDYEVRGEIWRLIVSSCLLSSYSAPCVQVTCDLSASCSCWHAMVSPPWWTLALWKHMPTWVISSAGWIWWCHSHQITAAEKQLTDTETRRVGTLLQEELIMCFVENVEDFGTLD